MNIDKKTVAFILIGVGVAGVAWYLYKQYGSSGTLEGATSGSDSRGVWAAEDDTIYMAMRDAFASGSGDPDALGSWIDDGVMKRYEAGGSAIHKIQNQKSKAGTFLTIFEEVNPNDGVGRYLLGTDTKSESKSAKRQLWPESLHKQLWKMFYDLKAKYPAL